MPQAEARSIASALTHSNDSQFTRVVMPGLEPGIHETASLGLRDWMAGSSPAMTDLVYLVPESEH